MRWEGFFADLEAQWEAEQRRELDAEVAERTRGERAALDLVDRLCAHRDRPLRVHLRTATMLDGVLADLGGDWLLLRTGHGREALVPVDAVSAIGGLVTRASGGDALARRFGLGSALRVLARDRATVALTDSSGHVATGTIDRVWRDVLDLAEHPLGELRRAGNVTGVRSVPFAALVAVESR